ncbi:hypothetical protein D9M70_509390 [compost metagenome]
MPTHPVMNSWVLRHQPGIDCPAGWRPSAPFTSAWISCAACSPCASRTCSTSAWNLALGLKACSIRPLRSTNSPSWAPKMPSQAARLATPLTQWNSAASCRRSSQPPCSN